MTTIAVITHVDRATVGLIDEVARDRGHDCRVVRPYRGEQLPGLDEVGAVVAMGGPQAAYEDHSYLADEERFLAEAVHAEVPVLAICLGSQVLARALGGSAYLGDSGLEAGIIKVKPADTASCGITGEFFSFHSDSMTPPADAEVLATSDRYVQAWSFGSALAVQFHPEMTMAGVRDLLGVEGPKLDRYGVDVAAMQAEAERYFAAGAADSRSLLDGWFNELPSDRSRN